MSVLAKRHRVELQDTQLVIYKNEGEPLPPYHFEPFSYQDFNMLSRIVFLRGGVNPVLALR